MLTVVVALDGSPVGEGAALAISHWAAASVPLTVHLVSILRTHDIGATAGSASGSRGGPMPHIAADQYGDVRVSAEGPGMGGSESRDQALTRARTEREDYLREVGERFFKGVHPAVHVEFSDDTADEILAAAKRVGADAIAMGTHGRTGVRRVLAGSVAEAVVRGSQLPVILVGPHGETHK